MRKARNYRSRGLASFGRYVGRAAYRKVSNMIHTFRKQSGVSTIVETGANQHLTYVFRLDQLPEVAEFKELYDQYKIKKIILTYEPVLSGSNTAGTAPLQKWTRIVHDYDDNTPLTTEAEYLEYSNCKSVISTKQYPTRTVLYPKVLKPALGYTGLDRFSGVKSGWLSTDWTDVQHLGLKIMIPSLGLVPGAPIYNVRATYVLQFKNSR